MPERRFEYRVAGESGYGWPCRSREQAEDELARIRRRRDLLNQPPRYWVERRTVTVSEWEPVDPVPSDPLR